MAFLLLAGMPATGAIAQQAPCQNANTQLEMNQCADQQAKNADKTLNSVYHIVMEKIGPEDKLNLRAAEQAWIRYRDTNCSGEAALYKGGSIAPLIESTCLAKNTQERTEEIRRIYVHFLDGTDRPQ